MTYKLDNNGKPYAVDLNELLESKFTDPVYAIDYLKETLEDGEYELFFAALGDIAKVNGMSQLSESTGLNRENLYRMLSPKGNPTFKNIVEVLGALDLELRVSYKTVPHQPHFESVPVYVAVDAAPAIELFNFGSARPLEYRAAKRSWKEIHDAAVILPHSILVTPQIESIYSFEDESSMYSVVESKPEVPAPVELALAA
jgi:probable addiction module antidote protein